MNRGLVPGTYSLLSRSTRMSGCSAEYRRLADQCFGMAAGTLDHELRSFLLANAQRWLDLAEVADYDEWYSSRQFRAVQAGLSEGLQKRYTVPFALPPQLLVLLCQLNAENAGKSGSLALP
jgi:hypothetical protein